MRYWFEISEQFFGELDARDGSLKLPTIGAERENRDSIGLPSYATQHLIFLERLHCMIYLDKEGGSSKVEPVRATTHSDCLLRFVSILQGLVPMPVGQSRNAEARSKSLRASAEEHCAVKHGLNPLIRWLH